MLSNKVDLRKHARILKVVREGPSIIVTLADRNKAVPGRLTLIFDDGQNILKEWIVVDGENRRTTISLVSMHTSEQFSAKLFVVKKPTRDPDQDGSR